jgi:hypothetical protein
MDIDLAKMPRFIPYTIAVDWATFSGCKFRSLGVAVIGTPGQALHGFDDWKNLDYNFRDGAGYPYGNNGIAVPLGESPDEPIVEEIRRAGDIIDFDSDGFANNVDNCPALPNPDQRLPPNAANCGVAFGRPQIVYLPVSLR